MYMRDHLRTQFDALCLWKGVSMSGLLNMIVQEYCTKELTEMEKSKTFDHLLRKVKLQERGKNIQPPKLDNIHSRKVEKVEEKSKDTSSTPPLPDWRDDLGV